MVAVFAVGGVIGALSNVNAAKTLLQNLGHFGTTDYGLFNDENGNYFIVVTDQAGEIATTVDVTSDGYGARLNSDPSLFNENSFNEYRGKLPNLGTIGTEVIMSGKVQTEGQTIPTLTLEGPNGLEQILGSMIAWFLYYIAVGLGWIMMLITKVMLIIGIFNNFLGQPAVQVGWTITRDICNNFFIVLMMILAAGVTLHLPTYAWRTLLPKILIFAVIINFSMTITGILIDVSQVLMLTFASPLSTVQGYNIIISAFGLPDAFSMTKVIDQWAKGSNGTNGQITNTNGVSFYDIIAALLFAIIVTIVAIVVITCITVILVYRIIMLMFLVILSPLFFLAKAAPNISALGQVSSEWMGNLSKMLIIGPAMMFFLYLSFMTMAAVNNLNPGASGTQKGSLLIDPVVDQAIRANENLTTGNGTNLSAIKPQTGTQSAQPGAALTTEQDYSALSEMASVQGVVNFLIVVGLLWVSLMMGQKFGDAAGKVASGGMGWMKGAAKKYSGYNLGKSAGKMAIGRGKEFAGDVTGIAALSGGVKAYFAKGAADRKTARDLRIGEVTGRIQAGATAVKTPFAKASTWLKDNTWNREAKRQEADINEGKAKMDQLANEKVLENIGKKENFTHNGNSYEYNAATSNWKIKNSAGNDVADNVDNDKLMRMLTSAQNTSHVQDIHNKKDFVDANGNKYNWNGTAWTGEDSSGASLGPIGTDDDLLKFRNNNETIIDDVENKKSFVRDGISYNWSALHNRWDKLDKKGNFAGTVNYADRDQIYSENGGVTAQDLENKEITLSQKREKVARYEKYARWAITGASAMAGGFALPSVLLGAGAGALAAQTGIGIGRGLSTAGEQDLKLGRNYKADQVEARRKDFKELGNDELTAKMDDYTLDKFSRIAAAMEALSRGILSKSMAQRKKNEILELSGRDAKMAKNLDTELQKNYIDLSKNFTDLADITKRDKAQLKIGGDVASGKIAMKDLDPKSLNAMAARFADTLSKSRFVSQFKDLAAGQQEAITNALKTSATTYNQREKLAGITDVNKAFAGAIPGDKEKFIGKLSTREIQDMIDNNEADKITALKSSLNGNDTLLAASVKAALTGNGSRATQLRNALGL
jgi:hypothetical protein